MEVPRNAVICAARHFVAAHESAVKEAPVDFGKICEGCELLPECQADWLKTAAPIFETAGVYPNLLLKD